MGALHNGHASLIQAAVASARPTVVTVFVNPTQFGVNDDLAKYPRTLDADCALAERFGASGLFVPSVDAMYPSGIDAARLAALDGPIPAAATQPQLEDAHRRGHFGGVCQVVSRLFDLTRPSLAFFGEKDYQQLLVIRQMVARSTRWGSLRIIGCPTIREHDGLAMSSRNRYLDDTARQQASVISRALCAARDALAPLPSPSVDALQASEETMRRALADAGFSIDYAVIRDAETLLLATAASSQWRGLVAARLGSTRLIDNLAVWECPQRD